MYDDIAWKYFEKTGDITAYLEYKKLLENKNIYENEIRDVDNIENNQNKGYSN